LVLGTGLYLAGATHTAAQQRHQNSPDLGVANAAILTMDAGSSVAGAIAIRNGKILAVGGNASIEALIGTQTRVSDVADKAIVPGLIDTHAHFEAAGMADYVVNMSRVKTAAEASDAIKAFAAKKKPGEWSVGDPRHPPSQLVDERYLTRQEIGAAAAISREQALRFYTSVASRCVFDEERKGALEPGKLAARWSSARTT
jgi:predicted amidohydrolase YtcJ